MDLNFNNMNDDDFRKEFLRFLTMYQSGLEDFMKNTYQPNKPLNENLMDDERLEDLFKKIQDNIIPRNNPFDEDGWDKKSWSSPDGLHNFTSFSRSGMYNPFNGNIKFNQEPKELDTLKLLNQKLNKSIMEENYEDAAKIRDLIKTFEKEEN